MWARARKAAFASWLGAGGMPVNKQWLMGGHIRDGHFVWGSSSATLWPTAVPAVAGICVRGDGGQVGTGFP